MVKTRIDPVSKTMDDKLWIKAKELFHEAQAKPPSERDVFLNAACGDNEPLREQVQQLIDSYESGFMNEPALGKVVEAMSSSDRLTEGELFGRYRVVRLIGSGGMGEVYLAHDDELDRPVALKLLHRDVAEDKERLRRFIQEARAASALNHPNILTIYEIGSHEGARFIVSEYIDGDTLRDRMRAGITPAESVDITCQVATALQAAHAAADEMRTALLQLSPRVRAAVVLRYFDDLSEAETARLMGCSASTVNKHVGIGLRTLRTLLTPQPDTAPASRRLS